MATLVNGNGNPAVYAQQDADLYVGVMGTTSCIMSVGSKFAATIETANLISVADGVILTKEGRRIQTDVGEVDEFNIPNGAAGVTRYYIIGYHLYTDGQGSQKCETFVQLMSSATDTIPEAEFRNGATEVYVSLYRVTQVGLTLNDPESLLPDALNIGDINASLTDNGHSFDFGFDTTSSKYGYYDADHNFKSFGGGNLDTLCKVKSALWWGITDIGSNYVGCLNDDGAYKALTVSNSRDATLTTMQTLGSDLYSSIDTTGVTSSAYARIRLAKTGYYMLIASNGSGTSPNLVPMLYSEGDYMFVALQTSSMFSWVLLYLGIELSE